MPNNDPWYDVINGENLRQGDILFKVPSLTPEENLPFPLPSGNIVGVRNDLDAVIMTQSCDLEHDKTSEILFCPHWDVTSATDEHLRRFQTQEEIRKGKRPRYMLLDKFDDEGISIGIRIVDFGKPFSLPKKFTVELAKHQGKRLRLRSPYREELSQRFGTFFMRVALPTEIDLSSR